MCIRDRSYADVIEYFGYLKKMILTLHNLAMIEKGWLPLHGAMINLTLQDGTKKGVIMIGDSGAGKSETIEALTNLSEDVIVSREIIFDDMGSLHLDEQGQIRAQGTEIGAFVPVSYTHLNPVLAVTEPTAFPIAISVFPCSAASTETIISGRVVALSLIHI